MNLSQDLRERLAKALARSYQVPIENENKKVLQDLRELNRLSEEILKKSESFSSLFWSIEERNELQHTKKFYESRIQNMIRLTLANLDWYQKEGWKVFAGEGEEK